MDIDDILREVDPSFDTILPETRDLQALTRAWVAERSTPELLDYPPTNLIPRISTHITAQITTLESLTSTMDPRTNFSMIVIQTELERYRYLLRSYLRARLQKIDRHTLHYLSTPALRALLSPAELAYATKHQALLHDHYLSSFLGAFPQGLQNLNDTAGNVSMVDAPDKDGGVFVRLLRATLVAGRGVDADGTFEGKEGDILILRWDDGKVLVEAGDAEVV